LSKNLYRRHLTDDQRAAVAAEMVPTLEVEAKKRIGAGGPGRPKSDGLVESRSDQKAADLCESLQTQSKVSKRKVKKARDGLSPVF
jgi:hypothetical protein